MKQCQVVIIGAGPSGLLLAQLLHRQGIDSVVLEQRSRPYVEARIRAGLLEQGTVDLLQEAGVAQRLHEEALVHGGFEIAFGGRVQRIDLAGLTGKRVSVYGQTDIQRDLGEARDASGRPVHYEARDVEIEGWDGGRPRVVLSLIHI